MCHMSGVSCQVSDVRFQMSGVRCQVSGVVCHMSYVKCFFLQSGGAYQGRVCYQRGLSCLAYSALIIAILGLQMPPLHGIRYVGYGIWIKENQITL